MEGQDAIQTPPSPWDPCDLSCLHPSLHHPASLKYPDGLDYLMLTTLAPSSPILEEYGTAHTLFISWRDCMKGVKEEITRLDESLKKLRFVTSGDKYMYTSKHFEIPKPRRGDKDIFAWPTATLKQTLYKALVKRASTPTSLLTIYYGGHSRIEPDLDGTSIWFATKTSQHLEVPLQPKLTCEPKPGARARAGREHGRALGARIWRRFGWLWPRSR
ncbi:hypothetical protein V8F33_008863 [Rhypophila sp. PSN 637]